MTNTTLTLNVNIQGAVIDAVVLADSLASYGIKRDTDNSVIVATGAAVTTVSNSGGVGQFTYTTTLLDTTLSYTAAWKISYTPTGGAQQFDYVTTSAPAQVGIRSLVYLRRALAERLGGFDLLTTSGVSASNTQLNVQSIIGELDSSDSYEGSWVFLTTGTSAGDQRRIAGTGIDATSGVITVNRPFTTTPATNTTFEIHTKLPAIRQSLTPGIREIINQVLAGLWTIDRVDFPTSLTEQFLLTPDWLVNKGHVLDVYRPSASGYRPYKVGEAYTFKYDAESPFMEGVMVTETGWQMDVVRPGNTWIKVGGVWQESTSGLVNDTDECLFPPQVVVAIGLYYAYDALSKAPWESDTSKREWRAMAVDWAPIAAAVKRNYMPEIDTSPASYGHSNTPAFGMKGLLGW